MLPPEHAADVRTLWEYHDLGHELQRCDVGIGLGCHDIGVAEHAAELFGAGWFPRLVFTGANAPTTVQRFPRGEAVHFRERALELGVPDSAILLEPRAANTGENIAFTRDLLAARGIPARRIMLISRPYQQRRAYATARKRWPGPEFVCASRPLPLEEYVATIGDADRVINMLVGDTQRITAYADRGFALPQPVPPEVRAACTRLITAGYTTRLLPE